MVRHLPNALSLARLLAVPAMVVLLGQGRMSVAFWLFLAAGATDAIDGAVARFCDARSRVGEWLDPLADKALLIAVYAVLAWMGALPLWLVVLVVLRDVLIMVYAMVAALVRGFHGAPLPISKINTAAQIVLAAVVLARLGPGWGTPFLTEAGVAVVAVTTVVSGAAYVLTIRRRPILAGDGNREMGA